MLQRPSILSCEVLENYCLGNGKATWDLWCVELPIQTIRNAQELQPQPAPKCRCCERERIVFPSIYIYTGSIDKNSPLKIILFLPCLRNPSLYNMLRLFARGVKSLPWRPCPPHAFAYLDRTAFDNGIVKACYISLTNSKTGDDPGLAAKIIKHSPVFLLNALLHVMREQKYSQVEISYRLGKIRLSSCC